MIKPLGILLTATGLLLSNNQGLALSFSASGGSNYYGIEASQTIFPRVRAGLGYASTDDRGREAKVYNGSLMFSPILPGLDLAIGGRYQYPDTDYGSGSGLGIGGSAFVETPLPQVSVGGYAFYTPQGLAHGDVDESHEYGAQARARLFSQT